ncbi:hypothetical protein H8959_012724 [Pygathrix nigripes]
MSPSIAALSSCGRGTAPGFSTCLTAWRQSCLSSQPPHYLPLPARQRTETRATPREGPALAQHGILGCRYLLPRLSLRSKVAESAQRAGRQVCASRETVLERDQAAHLGLEGSMTGCLQETERSFCPVSATGTPDPLLLCHKLGGFNPGLARSLRGNSSEDGRRGTRAGTRALGIRGQLLPRSPAPCSPVGSLGTPVGGPHPAGDTPATAKGPQRGLNLPFHKIYLQPQEGAEVRLENDKLEATPRPGARRRDSGQAAWRMATHHTLWMGLVLLGLLGGLQAAPEAQVSVQPNFQPDKFLGRWFSAGLASNSSWLREKKAALSMCKSVVAPAADGGFNLTSTFLRKNQCETRTMLLQPAESLGSYSYQSPHWGSTYSVSVVETDYDHYALLYSQGSKGPGEDFRMATLYSRTQTPRAELKEKFTAFCKAQGFTEDTIVFLPQTDKCMTEQ